MKPHSNIIHTTTTMKQ